MISRFLSVSFLATLVLLGARPSHAQDAEEPTETTLKDSDAARETASQHFRRGVELFQETHYRAALIEFERAYETLPDFRLHYNIAQTKRLLKDYVGAVASYERYLADGSSAVPEARRKEVEEQLEHMRERTAHLTITSNRESVRIFVDDQLVGVTPITSPVTVNVGRHVVEARSAEGVESSEVVDVAGGDARAVYLPVEALEPATEPAEPQPAAAPEPPPAPAGRTAAQRYAISAIVIGGSAVLGGVAAGVVAAIEQKNFDEAIADGKLGAATKHSDRVQRSALATDVLVSVGLALAVSGIVTWVVKKPSKAGTADRGSELRVGMGPGSVSLQGSF